MKQGIYLLISLYFLAGCGQEKTTNQTTTKAIHLEYMDTTVHPGDDFFRFVNGTWMGQTEIPAEYPAWGSFTELRDQNDKVLAEVLRRASSNPNYKPGSDQWKVAKFYEIGIDSLLAEEQGLTPLLPMFNKIDQISSTKDIQTIIAELGIYGVGVFYALYGSPDEKNSKKQVAYLYQLGMGLPDRDYYLKNDPKSKEIRNKYVQYISRSFQFLDYDKEITDVISNTILKLETRLANISLDKVEMRKPENTYNKMSINDLSKLTPSVDWDRYFSESGINNIDSIIVSQPKFMAEVEKIITTSPLEELKIFLKWHLLNDYAGYLNNGIAETKFNFYGKELSGVEKMQPRWKRVIGQIDESMGEALGKLYVDSVFPPAAKEKALEMVDNIKIAFGERIKQLEWMTDVTKQKALEKLSTFIVKIGYPDEWRSYDKLEIDTNMETASYAAMVMNARKFEHFYQIKKIGNPVDKNEWHMTPQMVNAYYNPLFNEIVFPAGILQPPFYNYMADDAVNYGGIGGVIGHEISHGFDDQGCKYDAEGNLNNWWTEQDLTQFESHTKMLVKQFDQYTVGDSVFVNGAFTLGENIGDLGGINVAYDGLQKYLKENGRPELIDGFTPEQRFFISWANCWRIKCRDAFLRNMVMTNPHSPGEFRVRGPLENMETFYLAFNVTEGNAMWKPDSMRVHIW